ncbi:MAG TPA: hypothetical protein DCE23_06175 [Firmicutes bacterium]|nr:hypothetical protein [Bacillota bacterium]
MDSVLDNELDNIEIILVNDGSKDNTLKIIKEYKKKYKDIIKLVDQENQGLSMARNAGIEVATGEYITFLDSDDYVDSKMYSSMLEKAEENNFDLVVCGLKMLYPNYELNVSHGLSKDCNSKDEVKEVMYNIYPAAWNKIYKREVIGNLRYKKGVWFEDFEFLYRLLPYVKSIGIVNEYYYYYLQREGSITYVYNSKLYDFLYNLDGLVEYYKNNGFYNEYKEELEYTYVRYLFATFIKRLAKMKDKKEFKKGVDTVLKAVKDKFPDYKKNKYLKYSKKGIYLKYFNKFIANIVFLVEKNKMN